MKKARKCPHCGSDNIIIYPDGRFVCLRCGYDMGKIQKKLEIK